MYINFGTVPLGLTFKTHTTMQTKTVISITKKSPEWTRWLFRIVFFVTTGICFWIAGTGLITANNKVEIMLVLKALDLVIWGIGKGLGVSKEEYDTDTPSKP